MVELERIEDVANEKITHISQDIAGLKQDMQGANQNCKTYINSESLYAGGFALSIISTGIFISTYMYEPYSKVFGAFFAAGGVCSLHLAGYSPIKIGKDVLETIGALACFPYDYLKKR